MGFALDHWTLDFGCFFGTLLQFKILVLFHDVTDGTWAVSEAPFSPLLGLGIIKSAVEPRSVKTAGWLCVNQTIYPYWRSFKAAADVKMEIPVLVWLLKSSILNSTSFQMGKTFSGVVIAAVEQSRRGCSGRSEIRPQRLTPESLQPLQKNAYWR